MWRCWLSEGLDLFSSTFGGGFYAACAISKAKSMKGVRSIMDYTSVPLIGMRIVAAVPWFSTGLL